MARDPETGEHSKRVADLAKGFGSFLGLRPAEVRSLYLAGLLHDIGKVGVRDDVLLKHGSLTPEEQQRIREHPRIAARILSPLGFEEVVRSIAVHHEHVDGSGYPDGLRGEEIPLAGRALAIVDTYDALRSRRPYKEPFLKAQVWLMMMGMAGGELDAGLLEKFWQFLAGLPPNSVSRVESGRRNGEQRRSTGLREPEWPHLPSMTPQVHLAHVSRTQTRRPGPSPANMILPSGSTCST
jgi:putative nucleotidyltransferase with HDIG domain